MAFLGNFPMVALLILVVIVVFNLIIFVHELGHFWAAKWRGLKIDRFQIWFGKPIWSKTINGVQYGLGWIPAGGFVALPQMAPMEAIEGGNRSEEPLPPIKPLDKIIVAFAGPLFSFLLALISAVGVWGLGKPKDFAPTQEVGEIVAGSPAEKAGFKVGDVVTHINGREVHGWDGRLDSVFMQIVTSQGDQIHFTVKRPGEEAPVELVSTFDEQKTEWYQRRGLRRVGIWPKCEWVIVTSVADGSPAEKAGMRLGDRVVSIDGRPFTKANEVVDYIRSKGTEPMEFEYHRGDIVNRKTVTAQVPTSPAGKPPMIGAGFDESPVYENTIVHPTPLAQVKDTVEQMWVTITSVLSPKSSIGIQHLNGPVGIISIKYEMLLRDHPWQRLLGFLVLLNINLAIMNLLPFPVLDGGHITMATLEAVARRPVQARVLQYVQAAFAVALMSLMLFVTTKDIGDKVRPKKEDELVFPD